LSKDRYNKGSFSSQA